MGLPGRKVKEIFVGPRLAVAVPATTKARSLVAMVVLSAIVGVIVAVGVATAIWYLVQVIVRAIGS